MRAINLKRGPLTAVAIGLAAVGLITFAVTTSSGGSGTASILGPPSSSAFESATTACAEDSLHITLLDDGRGLSVAGEGEESPGASIVEIVCVLDELDVPEAVVSRMTRTRALDGTQDASWSGVQASWTYHPDAGLDIIFEEDS